MKITLLSITAIASVALTLGAAESNPKEELTTAAKKLGDKENYSWRTTVVVPEDAPIKPGAVEGKAERNGYTWLTVSFGDTDTKAVLKGDKGVATDTDGQWKTLEELTQSEGPIRFLAMRLQSFKAPAAQTLQLISFAKDLKKEGDVYSGELTPEGAKTLLGFGQRPGGDAPTVSNAKGSFKIWVKDGAVTKYEYILKGTMSFGGNEMEQDRTSTVVIKDVGSTKVSVPEEAKKKLS